MTSNPNYVPYIYKTFNKCESIYLHLQVKYISKGAEYNCSTTGTESVMLCFAETLLNTAYWWKPDGVAFCF